MSIINFLSDSIVPCIICIVVIFGIKERKKVFDLFIDGVKDGAILIFRLFPTLLRIIFFDKFTKNIWNNRINI